MEINITQTSLQNMYSFHDDRIAQSLQQNMYMKICYRHYHCLYLCIPQRFCFVHCKLLLLFQTNSVALRCVPSYVVSTSVYIYLLFGNNALDTICTAIKTLEVHGIPGQQTFRNGLILTASLPLEQLKHTHKTI